MNRNIYFASRCGFMFPFCDEMRLQDLGDRHRTRTGADALCKFGIFKNEIKSCCSLCLEEEKNNWAALRLKTSFLSYAHATTQPGSEARASARINLLFMMLLLTGKHWKRQILSCVHPCYAHPEPVIRLHQRGRNFLLI